MPSSSRSSASTSSSGGRAESSKWCSRQLRASPNTILRCRSSQSSDSSVYCEAPMPSAGSSTVEATPPRSSAGITSVSSLEPVTTPNRLSASSGPVTYCTEGIVEGALFSTLRYDRSRASARSSLASTLVRCFLVRGVRLCLSYRQWRLERTHVEHSGIDRSHLALRRLHSLHGCSETGSVKSSRSSSMAIVAPRVDRVSTA